MKKIKIEKKILNIPPWLEVDKSLVPDFVIKNPKKYFYLLLLISKKEHQYGKSLVQNLQSLMFIQLIIFLLGKYLWENKKKYFIRFPRVVKIRSDKNWKMV